MSTIPASTSTRSEVITENAQHETPVHIQLNFDTSDAPATSRRVAFDEAWVDNENLEKRKSKCCCIFTKQRLFDESSSEDDDDCPDHCHGKKGWHKKKGQKKNGEHNHDDHDCHSHDNNNSDPSPQGSNPVA